MSKSTNVVLSLRWNGFYSSGNHSTASHLPPGHLDLTYQPHKDRVKNGGMVTKITHGVMKESIMVGNDSG